VKCEQFRRQAFLIAKTFALIVNQLGKESGWRDRISQKVPL
jgi:hypothetical protein